MRKIVLLDDYFPTGEQTIQPVLLWGPGRGQHDLSHVTKTASEALDYIKNVSPEPGKTHMLVLALGGEETYGPNRNGDGFPERPVPAKNGRGYWVAPGEELTSHYQSFEKNPAHAFMHHQNKDPKKASGVVKKAFWNPKMHRVELLIVVDNQKDPEWVQRVNDGDFPAVSMGCRIKYDVCSRCGNKAPTRAQYCDHVKFGMNQVNGDGTKNYVHNPSASFFDISRVFRPADRTGYTLKKVAEAAYEIRTSAELGEVADDVERKSAAIRKLSDIDKIVRGEPVAAASNLGPDEQKVIRRFKDYAQPRLASAPPLPIEELLRHNPKAALSTLSSLGVSLNTPEFLQWIVSLLSGGPVSLPEHIGRKTAAALPCVFDLLERAPALLDHTLKIGILDEDPAFVNAALQAKLAPLAIKRANVGEMVYRRLVPEGVGLRPDEAPRTDMLSYTDPGTGQTMQTNRGAAVDAQDALTRSNVRKAIGGGALLLGGYKLLSMHPALRPYKIPLALGAGMLGYHALRPSQHPRYMTNEGISVPSITEFAPKTATENVAGAVVDLIDEYKRAGLETTAGFKHAFDASVLVKLGVYEDNIRGVGLDFETVAQALGEVICS